MVLLLWVVGLFLDQQILHFGPPSGLAFLMLFPFLSLFCPVFELPNTKMINLDIHLYCHFHYWDINFFLLINQNTEYIPKTHIKDLRKSMKLLIVNILWLHVLLRPIPCEYLVTNCRESAPLGLHELPVLDRHEQC